MTGYYCRRMEASKLTDVLHSGTLDDLPQVDLGQDDLFDATELRHARSRLYLQPGTQDRSVTLNALCQEGARDDQRTLFSQIH